jgi:hypothetical protein
VKAAVSFKAKRIKETDIQQYAASPAEVFPLLCPVREYEWLYGWNCEMIYSESGIAEEGCVFTTKFPGEEEETVWVMTDKDLENHTVQYVRVTPGCRVVDLLISLENNSDGCTNAHITYTITALSEIGNAFIDSQAGKEFTDLKNRMEKSMNHFLKTGRMLKM